MQIVLLAALSCTQDQLPLRDPGIDFPMTVHRLFSSQFKVAYKIIVRKYPTGGESHTYSVHEPDLHPLAIT